MRDSCTRSQRRENNRKKSNNDGIFAFGSDEAHTLLKTHNHLFQSQYQGRGSTQARILHDFNSPSALQDNSSSSSDSSSEEEEKKKKKKKKTKSKKDKKDKKKV